MRKSLLKTFFAIQKNKRKRGLLVEPPTTKKETTYVTINLCREHNRFENNLNQIMMKMKLIQLHCKKVLIKSINLIN